MLFEKFIENIDICVIQIQGWRLQFSRLAINTVDGTLRGQPLRGQNDDFENRFRGTLRGHRGTFMGQNGDFPKGFFPLRFR